MAYNTPASRCHYITFRELGQTSKIIRTFGLFKINDIVR